MFGKLPASGLPAINTFAPACTSGFASSTPAIRVAKEAVWFWHACITSASAFDCSAYDHAPTAIRQQQPTDIAFAGMRRRTLPRSGESSKSCTNRGRSRKEAMKPPSISRVGYP